MTTSTIIIHCDIVKLIPTHKNKKSHVLDADKSHILDLFNKNVRGVEICIDSNKKYCGKEGYWLETKMGVSHNDKNEPDINGYEMKKYSKKTTLGDFSASEYMFLVKINGTI